jgi:transposase-like protein
MDHSLISTLISIVPSTVVAIIAFCTYLQSRKNTRRIAEVHTLINSQLEKWVAAAVAQALGQGRAEGVERERIRADATRGE